MTIPNATDTPTAYDVLVLAGKASPGVVKLTNVKRTTGWDQQESQGQDFANTVKKGAKLVAFTATWKLTKDERRDDFAAWELWSPILDSSTKAKGAKGTDAYHPELAELKVKSVVVTSRGAREPLDGDETGAETVSVEFLEYNPPKPAPATTVAGSKDKTAPDPNADVKAQLADRESTLSSLQQGFNTP